VQNSMLAGWNLAQPLSFLNSGAKIFDRFALPIDLAYNGAGGLRLNNSSQVPPI
jgi:hypothetical protein